MHCQSREETHENPSSPHTNQGQGKQDFQAHAEKDLNDQFIFGYDGMAGLNELFHTKKTSSCPASNYTKPQRHLHNNLSCNLLKQLPLPLLAVMGIRARSEYHKPLQQPRHLKIISNLRSSISFDLNAEHGILKRIRAYTDHLSSYFMNSHASEQSAVPFDATLNFSLWLVGRDYARWPFREN